MRLTKSLSEMDKEVRKDVFEFCISIGVFVLVLAAIVVYRLSR